MATIISNPTTSFRSSIIFARTTSSNCNLQTTNCLIGSSSSSYSFTSKKLLFRYRNQQKVGFRSGISVRRFVISCGVTEIDQTQFSETVLNSDIPVLVEFVANWCGPCRLISPAIDWASQEYKDRLKVVKIDHDSNPQLIEEYKVYGLPALILFKKGKEVPESRREGAISKVKLKEYLDGLLESIAVT